MPRLCVGLCSLITEQVLQELKSNGLKTVEDLLSAAETDIESIYSKVSLSDDEVNALVRILFVLFGKLPPSAAAISEKNKLSIAFSTGSERLDTALGGRGITTGTIVEINGLQTEIREFCLGLISTAILSTPADYVVYMDCLGGFSSKRFKNILQERAKEDANKDVDSLMKRVVVCTTTDIFQLLSKLAEVKSGLCSEEHDDSTDGQVIMVVIDSLPDLLIPLLGCEKEVSKLIRDVQSIMSMLVHNFSLAMLYTSNPSQVYFRGYELKEQWNMLPDARLDV